MERKLKSLILGAAGTLLVLGGTVLAPVAAQAGADGRKNTTIALGAASVWELLHHQTLAGVALGAGAVYAEKQYEDSRQSERDAKNRQYYYQNGDSSNNNSYRYNPNDNNNNDSNYNDNNDRYGNGNDNNSNDNSGNYDSSNGQSQASGAYYYKHGNKTGWNGRNTPPGQSQKQHRDQDNNDN